MVLMLKKKPKPLSFKQELNAVRRGLIPRPKPQFKKRPDDKPDDRRQTEFWTLERSADARNCGMSVSAIEQWLDCREQFRLTRAQGFRGPSGSEAIDFGEWWHWLLGRHYSNKHVRAKNPMEDMKAGAGVYRANYLRDNPNANEKRREALETGFMKTAALWPTYLSKYKDDDAAKKWVGIEHEFEFDFSIPPLKWKYRPEWLVRLATKDPGQQPAEVELLPGMKVPIRGILDGVYRKAGKLWLFETKTKSRIDESEIEDTLHLDIQVMTYLYAIKRIFGEWPAGVTYNVIRNPSTKQKGGETSDAFIKRLTKEVEKDEDHYFKRWDLDVGQEDIDRFLERQLEPIMRDIQMWAEGIVPHYVHTKALNAKYGKADMYDPITKGDFTGVDRVSAKRKER